MSGICIYVHYTAHSSAADYRHWYMHRICIALFGRTGPSDHIASIYYRRCRPGRRAAGQVELVRLNRQRVWRWTEQRRQLSDNGKISVAAEKKQQVDTASDHLCMPNCPSAFAELLIPQSVACLEIKTTGICYDCSVSTDHSGGRIELSVGCVCLSLCACVCVCTESNFWMK